jgi:hypothetical protein
MPVGLLVSLPMIEATCTQEPMDDKPSYLTPKSGGLPKEPGSTI